MANSQKEIVQVAAGDMVEAWRSGVETCAAMNSRDLSRAADLAIASAGGYPKDINMYQGPKGSGECRSGHP